LSRKRAPGGGRKPRGHIKGKFATFSTRITPETRAALEREAARNDRSLSQESELRLKETLVGWGPDHINSLAQLVSRVMQSVETVIGAAPACDPHRPRPKPKWARRRFLELAWHQSAFTHAAARAAIEAILAHYQPPGPISKPKQLETAAALMMQTAQGPASTEADVTVRRTFTKAEVEWWTSPEWIGRDCARQLLSKIAVMQNEAEDPALFKIKRTLTRVGRA
jgi:hypothetical protein